MRCGLLIARSSLSLNSYGSGVESCSFDAGTDFSFRAPMNSPTCLSRSVLVMSIRPPGKSRPPAMEPSSARVFGTPGRMSLLPVLPDVDPS